MTQALLLNASFEPLTVIPLTRAVVLVLTDKAEIVAAGDGAFRSATQSMPVPTVVRLRTFVKVPYRGRLALTKRNLLVRDGFRCAYCPGEASTIDHVQPRSRGGQHLWENVVAACDPCNQKKGNRLLSELGWKLDFTPAAPKGLRWAHVAAVRTDPSWEPYLALS